MPAPTQAETSQKQYLNKARQLIARCRKDLRIHPHENLDHRQFVGWLVQQKNDWVRETFRLMKASVMYALSLEAPQNETARQAMEYLAEINVEGCLTKSQKTSAKKQKKFPHRDFVAIEHHLQHHPAPWTEDVRRWLISGILTGLRPIEWQYSRIVGEGRGMRLIVKNAKNSNDRAHGDERTLLLDGLEDQEREIIMKHVERAKEFKEAGAYSEFQRNCALALSKTTRKMWPNRQKYPSLYSLRHQFTADAKGSGFSTEEIAAMMGHAADKTAGIHYGRKASGYGIIRVRPDPEEVKRIRKTAMTYPVEPKPQQTLKNKIKPQPGKKGFNALPTLKDKLTPPKPPSSKN